MLDQLLASAGDRLDEALVRDLLGLAEADVLDGFVAALVEGDAVAGIALLDGLEERGRDARVFLDQVIDAVRARLVAALSTGAVDTAGRVATVARRLASIDPNRAGTGGLRLQLELALFEASGPSSVHADAPTTSGSAQPEAPPTPRNQVEAEPAAPERAAARPDAGRPAPRAARGEALAAEPAAPAPTPTPTATGPAATEPAAPAGAVTEPGATEPVTSGGVAPRAPDLDRLLTGWSGIVGSVRPATRAVISECRPLSVDGNSVTLGFPEAKAFLKDVAERKRQDIEAAVGGFLGRDIAIRCVATNLDLVPAPPADPEAAFVLAEARRIFADDLVDVGEVS
jgi:hypothetical protein